MTRGGFVCTGEGAGSGVAVGAEYGFVIVAAENIFFWEIPALRRRR
jgi:hypothetical protein